MKTTGIGSRSPVSRGHSRGTRATCGSFGSLLEAAAGGGAETAAGTARATPLASLAAPLTVEAADPDARRRQAHAYGDELLDELEALRRAILLGSVDATRLGGLLQRVRQRAMRAEDPRLDAILAEIELRVEIEAAKLDR